MMRMDDVLMTLIEIAEAVDAQIARLRKIRAIVETLLPSPTAPLTQLPTGALRPECARSLESDDPLATGGRLLPDGESLPLDTESVPAPVPKRRLWQASRPRTRVARTDHHHQSRRLEAPVTALTGAVPQGPVAVSAANVLRSRLMMEAAAPQQSASTPPQRGHSLDDLVRQLSNRSA